MKHANVLAWVVAVAVAVFGAFVMTKLPPPDMSKTGTTSMSESQSMCNYWIGAKRCPII